MSWDLLKESSLSCLSDLELLSLWFCSVFRELRLQRLLFCVLRFLWCLPAVSLSSRLLYGVLYASRFLVPLIQAPSQAFHIRSFPEQAFQHLRSFEVLLKSATSTTVWIDNSAQVCHPEIYLPISFETCRSGTCWYLPIFCSQSTLDWTCGSLHGLSVSALGEGLPACLFLEKIFLSTMTFRSHFYSLPAQSSVACLF